MRDLTLVKHIDPELDDKHDLICRRKLFGICLMIGPLRVWKHTSLFTISLMRIAETPFHRTSEKTK